MTANGVLRRAVICAAVLMAVCAPASALDAVILVHHPLDHVDPFGVAFAGSDTFAARYSHLVADVGRFDFPYFVADGVVSVRAIPNPGAPYVSTLGAYQNATEERLRQEPAVALRLTAALRPDGAIQTRLQVVPKSAQPQVGEQTLHVFVAVVEDAIHYEAPAAVSNGVSDHRFTVRSLTDLGVISLTNSTTWVARLATATAWNSGQLSVAGWIQADAATGRFAPFEVLQATRTQLGSDGQPESGVTGNESMSGAGAIGFPAASTSATQGKVVLVEVYSATWCNPCLYGDLAAEQLAIQHQAASPLKPAAPSYFAGASLLAWGAAALFAVLAAWPWRRA